MDIKEIKQKRSELEKTIFDLISAFQSDTGVRVIGINIVTVPTYPIGEGGANFVARVQVNIEI
jgi:hypothetical protein